MQHAWIYGIGAVVVAGAIGAWVYMGSPHTAWAPASTSDQTAGQPTTQSDTSSQPQTLKNLIAYKGSQKCTFTSSTSNSSSSGTVYVSNGQMRGDFVSHAQGGTYESHMIVKDNTSYVWGTGMPGGFKMSFDAMSSSGQGNNSGAVDPNAPVNYSCSAWSADASLFVLPAGIQFNDLGAMMTYPQTH